MGKKAVLHIKRIQDILAATAAPLETLVGMSAEYAQRQKLIGKLLKQSQPDAAQAQLDEARLAVAKAGDELEALRTELDVGVKHFAKFVEANGEQWQGNKALTDTKRFINNTKAYSRALHEVLNHADESAE